MTNLIYMRGWHNQSKRHQITSYGAFSLLLTHSPKTTKHKTYQIPTNLAIELNSDFDLQLPIWNYEVIRNKDYMLSLYGQSVAHDNFVDIGYLSELYSPLRIPFNFKTVKPKNIIALYYDWQLKTYDKLIPLINSQLIPFSLKYNNIDPSIYNQLPDWIKALYFYSILYALSYIPSPATLIDRKYFYLAYPSNAHVIYENYKNFKTLYHNKPVVPFTPLPQQDDAKSLYTDLTNFMKFLDYCGVLNNPSIPARDMSKTLAFIFTNLYKPEYSGFIDPSIYHIYNYLKSRPKSALSTLPSNSDLTQLDADLLKTIYNSVRPSNDIMLLFTITSALAFPSISVRKTSNNHFKVSIYNRHEIPYLSYKNYIKSLSEGLYEISHAKR